MAFVRRVLIEIVMNFEAANSVFCTGQVGSNLVWWTCRGKFSFTIS
jgi:hypothetical protein